MDSVCFVWQKKNESILNIAELQWLEQFWDHENVFETGEVRANELIIAPGQEA